MFEETDNIINLVSGYSTRFLVESVARVVYC